MKCQNTKDLPQAVDAYLRWMNSAQYSQNTIYHYQRILHHFGAFANASNIAPSDLFTCEALDVFETACGLKLVRVPVRGLARYLYENNQLEAPMKTLPETLPDIYEEYLVHYEEARNVDHTTIRRCRNVFLGLHRHLDDDDLSKLAIDQVDAFLKHYNAGYSPASQRHHRSCVRGLLQYLYCRKKILRRDLATLLTGLPFYAQAKPPRFLRQEEIERLFSSLRWERPRDVRCNTMIYLAYTLGLRPKEISLISLDDIAFAKEEIILPNRKNTTPLRLPLPEAALKAVVAYIAHARPQTDHRALFVNLTAPYRLVSHYTVSYDISSCLHKAGISESAYCLRHTYAQNLLEAGASIFQVKEMLGHDRIQTTQRYIHVHTRLMRKKLFDETL
jgi:site-specific recombinase XerD